MKLKALVLPATAATALALGVTGASAKDDDIRKAGTCTGSTTSKIKVKPDDGGLEVEFEVDQNRNGVKWKVRIKDNGDLVHRGRATTKAPSGSFSVERRIPNKSGTDRIKGIARNPSSGERCVARVSI